MIKRLSNGNHLLSSTSSYSKSRLLHPPYWLRSITSPFKTVSFLFDFLFRVTLFSFYFSPKTSKLCDSFISDGYFSLKYFWIGEPPFNFALLYRYCAILLLNYLWGWWLSWASMSLGIPFRRITSLSVVWLDATLSFENSLLGTSLILVVRFELGPDYCFERSAFVMGISRREKFERAI